MKHALLLGVLVAVLLPVSAGASQGAHLAATISGTAAPAAGGAADLTITNTGSTAIIFDRGNSPKPLDQASQDGKQCQVDGPQWRCGPFSVPAHGSFHILLHSPQGLGPADGPFQMFVSEDGQRDDGPFTIGWGGGDQGKPCKCRKLSIAASGVSSGQRTHPNGPVLVGMTITWRLTCTAGKGRCRGTVTALPPAGSDVKITQPGGAVACTAPCGTSSTGSFRLKATSANDLDFDNRANESYGFRFQISCSGRTRTKTVTLAFGPRGFLDRKRSDLNANGIPDGKER
jgi:hypothetical protein